MRYGVELTRAQPDLKRQFDELLDPVLTPGPTEVRGPGAVTLRALRTEEPEATPSSQVVVPTVAPSPATSPEAARRSKDGHLVLDEVFGLMDD